MITQHYISVNDLTRTLFDLLMLCLLINYLHIP